MSSDQNSPSKAKWWRISEWGFTVYERRAIWFIIFIILLGSAVRIYQKYFMKKEIELLVKTGSDSTGAKHSRVDAEPKGEVLLDINSASQEQLELLPGIAASKAQAIISYRQKNGEFHLIKELMNVSGIGPKIFSQIEHLVTVKKMNLEKCGKIP